MDEQTPAQSCCGRRQVLGASAASIVFLGACSSAAQRASDVATLNRDAATAAAEAAGQPIASTAEIPVGGGVIIADQETVITQPSEGEFRAFSSLCPHQGCAVASIDGTEIVCPCHDSRFDLATGEVRSGPARRGLTEMTVRVEGDDIVLG